MKSLPLLVMTAAVASTAATKRGIDPYDYLHGGTLSRGFVTPDSAQPRPSTSVLLTPPSRSPPRAAPPPNSPDPLAGYKWDLKALPDPLAYQVTHGGASSASASPAASFGGVASLLNASGAGAAAATVKAAGVLSLGWAQEGACWVEFDSPDLDPEAGAATLSVGISEVRRPLSGC